MHTYENPIIPGFYPDPSIFRVGEAYYLVNSSFEFFPGVPLWHSRDLVNWEQLGYILDRESQLPLRGVKSSEGIYAPTLRRHNDRWYMITTNVGSGGNFFVWAEDIHGPWSEPVYIDHEGIDPSLFWNDDGKVYYSGTHIDEAGRQGIGQFEIDLETGAKRSETKIIWYGTGGRYPEGPHMYKRNGWYYLMIAEGGTEYGHMQTIARGKSVWGPFESCPHNPILTHRNEGMSPFQALGHADIVEDPAGNWWMVFHAIRPTACMLHHIGRETMLAPMIWDENGWPVVNGGKPITAKITAPVLCDNSPRKNWEDRFPAQKLHHRWSWLRNPDMACYEWGKDGLKLRGSVEELNGSGSPSFLGTRQQQLEVCYDTELTVSGAEGLAGITVFHTNEHHYDLCVRRQGTGMAVWLRKRVVDMQTETRPVFFADTEHLCLRIGATAREYTFLAGTGEDAMVTIGTGSTQLLSTETMRGTFTGCFAGMFAEGNTEAVFRSFRCTETM